MTEAQPVLRTAGLHFRDQAEFDRLEAIKREAWTPWYAPHASGWTSAADRFEVNALAACLPEFLREARDDRGRQVAWVFSSPIWWSGDPQALHTLDHHNRLPRSARFRWMGGAAFAARQLHVRRPLLELARRLRADRVEPANTMMLIAMFVDDSVRGQRVAHRMIAAMIEQARQLGYSRIVGPFRPSGYGAYKESTGKAHCHETFAEYCELRRPDGALVDPWLRSVVRLGMKPLRAEARGFCLARSQDEFERFRSEYRPDSWREASPGVFECGQTPTWYLDAGRRQVVSFEPNLWGQFDVP